jgi:alpha-L-fucosidase
VDQLQVVGREPRRDKTGPLAGVPYDGVDPKFADLYHDADCARFVDKLDWNDDGIPESWKRHYLDRMTDLIDKYQPDLLYTDGHLPFEEYGPEDGRAPLQRERAVARRH